MMCGDELFGDSGFFRQIRFAQAWPSASPTPAAPQPGAPPAPTQPAPAPEQQVNSDGIPVGMGQRLRNRFALPAAARPAMHGRGAFPAQPINHEQHR